MIEYSSNLIVNNMEQQVEANNNGRVFIIKKRVLLLFFMTIILLVFILLNIITLIFPIFKDKGVKTTITNDKGIISTKNISIEGDSNSPLILFGINEKKSLLPVLTKNSKYSKLLSLGVDGEYRIMIKGITWYGVFFHGDESYYNFTFDSTPPNIEKIKFYYEKEVTKLYTEIAGEDSIQDVYFVKITDVSNGDIYSTIAGEQTGQFTILDIKLPNSVNEFDIYLEDKAGNSTYKQKYFTIYRGDIADGVSTGPSVGQIPQSSGEIARFIEQYAVELALITTSAFLILMTSYILKELKFYKLRR